MDMYPKVGDSVRIKSCYRNGGMIGEVVQILSHPEFNNYELLVEFYYKDGFLVPTFGTEPNNTIHHHQRLYYRHLYT